MEDLFSDLQSSEIWSGVLLVDYQNSNLDDPYTFEEALRFLPFEVQRKILSKRISTARNASLSNALLQTFGCSVASSTTMNELCLKYGTFGKPYLDNDHSIAFSMSNGQQYVVQYLVKTAGETVDVGIDIASKQDYINDQDIDVFRAIFSTMEYEQLESCSQYNEKRELFSYLWSLKECYTKLVGCGLNCDLSLIDFGKPRILESPAVIHRTINNTSVTFYSQWLEPEKEEVVTVCHYTSSATERFLTMPPKFYKLTLDDLIKYFTSHIEKEKECT
ncbi:hypothetical protein HG535_0D01750 [Zygotorulaspora mrakii]|uniref:holo-[acyl-carrier-protein] synthase n=1 Tax=Zygotorulaspora mrakii TaxID=42260 RepID=A0A7H9B1U9_ZYGMR|nr:uncharacterized protein HG535_0D01750 [Zygotorulaspora mrakii]QLG72467.1 hypothetical protein HG535_0D01750 [Zygotorulaspora mrakii]